MKRVRPVKPVLPPVAREEIALRSQARDARHDPGATAKISREELEQVLKRSTSGTRPAVRPETAGEPRTQSGERVAVRPESRRNEDVSSDALADEMYRAVQARTAEGSPEAVAAAPPPTVAAAPATTIPETAEPEALDVPDEDSEALRVHRTRIAILLVLVTTLLATFAWFAGRYVGVLLQQP